ncbi:glycosyltransferase [Lentzea sp. NPDC003310]|uniref:glycosyltransferase n=1 Tax=Lentzea sp. NPDC003310 TaxID=3154447 RepID=UPI0033A7D1B1
MAELCAGLRSAGHEVVVYTRRDDSTSPDLVRGHDGFEVVHVPAGPPRALTEDELVTHLGDFAEFVRRRWYTQAPDVVHAHHWTSGLVSLISAYRLRIPVVQSFHGFSEPDTRQRTEAEFLITREAAWFLATSTEEAEALCRLGIRRARVSVVPSGVDVSRFTPEGPVEFHDGRMRVVMAGEPACDTGAAAVGAVLSTVDHVELVSTDGVSRTGRPAVLRSAEVAVCAPSTERYGIAALEAMACGVPVVATAVGALKDVVLPGVTGQLVEPEDGRRLARVLKALLSDETQREQFGVAARDRVLSRYSRRRLAREALSAYQRALAVREAAVPPKSGRGTRA